MAYRKEQLEETVSAIIGSSPATSLGLPRAVEESAVQLFINVDADQSAVQLAREAVSDLRDFGTFKFEK